MSNLRPEQGPLRRAWRSVATFYWETGISDDVPALAWYLLSACVPLILGVAALTTLVLRDAAQAEQLASRLARLVPAQAHDQVVELVLRTRKESPLLLAIAVLSMIWVSAGATGVIERVGSQLLGVPRPGLIALKLRHLTLACGMVILIALMAIAATEATNLRTRLGVDAPRWVLSIAAALAIGAICALLYRFSTAHRVAWRSALLGGALAGIVLELTPLGAGYYARAVAGRTPVQVFLVLAGLLFSCYLAALGLLIGEGLAVGAGRAHRSHNRGIDVS